VPAAHDLVRRTLAALHGAGGALLIDLEFTCWEDSLRTNWADPARPAEVIEIGLATYRAGARAVSGSFACLVRPQLNPTLSDYCHDLLHIPQPEIDAAEPLPIVLSALEGWLRVQPVPGLPTCGWGAMDRVRLATNAAMLNVPDPLAQRPHIDLRAVMTALFDHPKPIERDELRALKNLPPNPRRHRALDDALDLLHFLPLLDSVRADR
jgi:inhibitor of KinA sporulation pathway (predicted exonuclease)